MRFAEPADVVEMRPPEDSVLKMRLAKVRALKMRSTECGVPEMRLR
jgi:hypothetical protein